MKVKVLCSTVQYLSLAEKEFQVAILNDCVCVFVYVKLFMVVYFVQEHHDNLYNDGTCPSLTSSLANCCKEQTAGKNFRFILRHVDIIFLLLKTSEIVCDIFNDLLMPDASEIPGNEEYLRGRGWNLCRESQNWLYPLHLSIFV